MTFSTNMYVLYVYMYLVPICAHQIDGFRGDGLVVGLEGDS